MARNNLARVQLQLRDIETDRVRVIGSGGVVYNDGRHSQATAVEIVRVVALDLCNRLGGVYFDAWVFGYARVYGDAWVYGDAQVFGNARVYGYARVYGDAWVFGDARVYGNARKVS